MAAHLLVVEDNEVERLGMVTLLLQQGFEVTPTANGDEALAFIRTFVPDLILLDMLMPKLDGWEFLRVRNHNPLLKKVPVIIVSGGAFASEQWAADLGAQAFLKKPIDTERMTETVKRLTTEPSQA